MKIAILGAGAMGCLYGAFLAESGENKVTLIDIWKDHMEAINTKGLTIDSVEGTRVVKGLKGVITAAEAEPVDLVIVFVKATATEEAIRQATNLVRPETMVLTLQNGLGNVDKLCRVLAPQNVIAGTTSLGANIKGPGHVNHAGYGDTVVGELTGGASPRLENLKAIFDRARLPMKISDNVMGLIWTKLIVNIGINALASVLSLKNGQLADYPESERLFELAVEEAAAVAAAKGIKLNTDDPVSYAKSVAKKTGENICSMRQDVIAKRPTEIAVINGAVVEGGLETGVATPVNMVLTNLILAMQKTYDLPR